MVDTLTTGWSGFADTLTMLFMRSWCRCLIGAALGIGVATCVGGWPYLAGGVSLSLLLYIGLCIRLQRLPPRYYDAITDLTLFKALRAGFINQGMTPEDAATRAAAQVAHYVGPCALHDPELIRGMVNRHGADHLKRYTQEVQDVYHRYWSTPPGAPRYGVFGRTVLSDPEEDAQSPWVLAEQCLDLNAAYNRCGWLNTQASCTGRPDRYVIAALAWLGEDAQPDSTLEWTRKPVTAGADPANTHSMAQLKDEKPLPAPAA